MSQPSSIRRATWGFSPSSRCCSFSSDAGRLCVRSRPGRADGGVIAAVARAAGAAEVLGQLCEGGRVVSAHRRVLNLESAAGRLLALHPPGVQPTPFSLILASLPDAPWPAAGAQARVNGDVLSAGRLQVSLANCAVVREAERVELVGDLTAARTLLEPWAAHSAFGDWWTHAPPLVDGLAARVAARGRAAILALVTAVRSEEVNHDAMLRASEGLMGLGPGATPSGDDFLLGFVAAWQRLDPEPDVAFAFAALLAEQAPARTTRLAAEFFYHLVAGRVSQLVEALLRSIAMGDRTAGEEATQCLASYGASSGRDTISGVHAYLLVRGAARSAERFN